MTVYVISFKLMQYGFRREEINTMSSKEIETNLILCNLEEERRVKEMQNMMRF